MVLEEVVRKDEEILTGRAVTDPKQTVEGTWSLDLIDFRKEGILNSPPGHCWTITHQNLRIRP